MARLILECPNNKCPVFLVSDGEERETWSTTGHRELGWWWPDEQDCPVCSMPGEIRSIDN